MRLRKEAELNAAILHFLAKCVAEGDHPTLADLGLAAQTPKRSRRSISPISII